MRQYRPHLLVLSVVVIALLAGLHNPLRNALSDLRFRVLQRPASGSIVLVAIDPPSIAAIGVWPWPRQVHARLVDRLRAAGVSDIVFDVDFSSPSNPAADQAFADALDAAQGAVILPAFQQRIAGPSRAQSSFVARPIEVFAKRSWAGIVNVAIDPDGLVRRYAYSATLDGQQLPSIGALLGGAVALNKPVGHIDFGIAAGSVPTVSVIDVLNGKPETLARLANKKVVIGATALELGDRINVPNGAVIPGALLQIVAAESILQGRLLSVPANGVMAIAIMAAIGLMMALWGRLSAGPRGGVLLALSATAELGAFVLQKYVPLSLDTSLLHVTVFGYLAALALDEIDFRALLGRISENRFEKIAMSMGDGLVCVDQNGLISIWNSGAATIFGYAASEIVGRPVDRLMPAAADARAASARMNWAELTRPSSAGKLIEIEGRRKNGDVFPLEVCISQWQGIDGVQHGAVMRDISERKREAARIRYLAEHDTLTGLASRNKVHERLAAALAEAGTSGRGIALLMMDLDKFKQINDSMGHACGDELLCQVGARLHELLPQADMIGRLGGDEFAVLLEGPDLRATAQTIAKTLVDDFRTHAFAVTNRQLHIGVSIGIALYPADCERVDELLANADLALYQAKALGRGGYSFFERRIRNALERRMAIEAELEQALAREEFELFYQPQFNLRTGKLIGAEALIRWRSPTRGLVLPEEFVPILCAAPISDAAAEWVMRSVCTQGRRWQTNGYHLRLGLNLSPSQFASGDLPDTVSRILAETGFAPQLLELEITENILLEVQDSTLELFRRLHALGVTIAFDDFGTGYASLTHLKKYPLDRLKIDKSFVSTLRAESDDMAIVGATISLGKLLGLSVIAEGIETAATASLLRNRGCDEGQGFYFAKPMPVREFEQTFLTGSCTLVERGEPMPPVVSPRRRVSAG